MIPQILHVYWAGAREPSWLRMQTIWTWARLHPGWEVRLQLGGPAGSQHEAAQQADLHRWTVLHEVGGWWSDLDVIYWRSPLDLIGGAARCTLWATYDGNVDQPWSIGLLAAKPAGPVTAELARRARAAQGHEDYQAAGSSLLRDLVGKGPPAELGIGLIPHDALYPRPAISRMMAAIWEETPGRCAWEAWPSHGLHWYAGAERAQELERTVTPEYDKPTILRRALQRAGCLEDR